MHSRIYVGQVRHRRYKPAPHAFQYALFMLYLDLDELPTLFSRRWLWSTRRTAVARFSRDDHLGDPAIDLASAVKQLVRDATGISLNGPIRLLTNLRYFGHGFNPVSFYYCFDPDGENLELIVAEVNNTPWGEQHCYILPESENRGSASVKRYLADKRFHVSPFMGMDIQYRWSFTRPGERLFAHLQNHRDGGKLFDASLMTERRPISSAALSAALLRYPFMTLKVVAAIYYQALRLWLKKTPFYPHPGKKEAPYAVKTR